AGLQILGDRFGEACLDGERVMRVPLDLRGPAARLDENRKLIEPALDRCVEPEVIQQPEHTLAEQRTAKQRVIRASQTDARYLQNVFGQTSLLIVQLLERELREPLVRRCILGVSGRREAEACNGRDERCCELIWHPRSVPASVIAPPLHARPVVLKFGMPEACSLKPEVPYSRNTLSPLTPLSALRVSTTSGKRLAMDG